jgi:integrase
MVPTIGKGFVYKDSGSNLWRAAIWWYDQDGKRKKKTRSTGVKCNPDRRNKAGEITRYDNQGKTAAKQFLTSWRDEEMRKLEEAAGVVTCETPLYRYVLDYIEMKVASGFIVDSTADSYHSYLRYLLGTELGNTPIRDVTTKQIQRFERDLAENEYSRATISHTHVLLKSVFIRARKMGDVSSNPFDLVDVPKRARKPINSLDKKAVAKINSMLAGQSDTFSVAVRIALMTGMRQGEICGLRWRDVDRTNMVIHVNHALTRTHGAYVLGDPKTATSIRAIPYGDMLADLLDKRFKRMRAEREELGLPWENGLYVVGSAINGRWKSPMALGQEWRAFERVVKLEGSQSERVRFHDLRHTFATLAIQAGVDVKTVSVILGHANAAMTLNVYADALADSKKASMDLMGKVMSVGINERPARGRLALVQ